jgi:four helix bundle protein
MRFATYDLSLDVFRGLRAAFAVIRQHDRRLAKQATDAMASVPLNIAEANGRAGGDRLYHFSVALGSLREVGAALDVAVIRGWLTEAPLDAERDSLCALLYRLQHPRR